MYYHVTTSEGVIYETSVGSDASRLASQITGARVRQGSLEGLREKSRQMFGVNWLKGPSTFTKALLAA